jgi:PIN domain
MQYIVSTPAEVAGTLTTLFESQGGEYKLEVLEDRCFGGNYLSVGSIELVPVPEALAADRRGAILDAIRAGAFEWKIPTFASVRTELLKLLGLDDTPATTRRKETDQYKKSLERVSRALDCVAHIAARLGLIHPRFDAGCIEAMPFSRPTTIVADTSAILQGALDFAAKFLHPTTRIKIPAVVHMEIVNQADRFLTVRRSSTANTRSAAALLDHLISQGGQRALLRLELQPDTEIERSAIFGDPLRNAFNRDNDDEFRDLNLSVPLRSYCDRLVLETARQHQSYSNPGHPVMILTSDQGLARMALAEGIPPLYFRAVSADDFFGEALTGTGFHPFTGELYKVSLINVLWELATAFGSARIADRGGTRSIEVAAIGEDVRWAPFYAQGDLLGARASLDVSGTEPAVLSDTPERKSTSTSTMSLIVRRPLSKKGFYKFNVGSMILLIDQLDRRGKLTERQVRAALQPQNVEDTSEYRKFLQSGDLIEIVGDSWLASNNLHNLSSAIRNKDFPLLLGTLQQVPSFREFIEYLREHGRISGESSLPFSRRSLPTYQALAELSCAGAPIAGEGFFGTKYDPPPSKFAPLALKRYEDLARGASLVSVGAWLESLIRTDGIHPIKARARLDEATAMGVLRLITEGSTLDTHHDRHSFRTLEMEHGAPVINVVHLYRGDFLIPGKASVSLRLESLT